MAAAHSGSPRPVRVGAAPQQFPQDAIDRVAKRLAYDEFPLSSGPDRQKFAARCWREYIPRAHKVLEAAFLTEDTVMTAWEWASIMREPQ